MAPTMIFFRAHFFWMLGPSAETSLGSSNFRSMVTANSAPESTSSSWTSSSA